jgi:hypothetical protein
MPWCRDCGKYKSPAPGGKLECGHAWPPRGSRAAEDDTRAERILDAVRAQARKDVGVPEGVSDADAARLVATGDDVFGADGKNHGQGVLMSEVRAALERVVREQRVTHIDIIGVLDALKHETEHDAIGDLDDDDEEQEVEK